MSYPRGVTAVAIRMVLRATICFFFFAFFFAIYYKLMKKANNEQDIKVEQLTYITCRRPASFLVWQPSEGDKNKLINVTKKVVK